MTVVKDKKKADEGTVMELSGDILVLEEIADGITKIAQAFKKIQSSRLKEDAVVTLMLHMIGPANINRKQIKAVLESAAKLDSYFLKPVLKPILRDD